MRRFILLAFFLIFFPAVSAQASTLSLSPSAGVFSVGSTFNVSVMLDTKGKAVNALQTFLTFPPDKLQVVSPSTGQSIIGVWTATPKYNNIKGNVSLEGGIPGGITTSSGVLTTITFRVKSVGEAIVRISDQSKVLLDDGLATDDLAQTSNAVYTLRLPPPQGPIVVSSTHPDQATWYQDKNAVLHFTNEAGGVEGFSYILSDDPITSPDNISEGLKQSVAYSNLTDGIHYFHIKSLRDGVWGGVTHFAIKVDITMPSDFPIELLPDAKTTSISPVAQFSATDSHSGIDYYEIKVEPLTPEAINALTEGGSAFFVEAHSPYVMPQLPYGTYDVVIRAYDKAGNYRQVSKHLTITSFTLKIIDETGIRLRNTFIIPWIWVWIIGLLLAVLLGVIAYKTWRWKHKVVQLHTSKELPVNVITELEELKKYREKYGTKLVILILIFASMLAFGSVQAQTREIAPPLITEISRDISNKEIFYVGGRTTLSEGEVIIYFQNLLTGETISHTVNADREGKWFYRHTGFLSAGDYVLWAQGKEGENMSPPGPQEKLSVKQTAIQFGSNRLSYETVYLFMIIIFGIIILGLLLFIIFHYYHGRKRYALFQKEVKEAEESIRRGFAVLRRDIEAELAIVKQAQPSAALSEDEKKKEAQLMQDLAEVEQRLGKEIWHISQEKLG